MRQEKKQRLLILTILALVVSVAIWVIPLEQNLRLPLTIGIIVLYLIGAWLVLKTKTQALKIQKDIDPLVDTLIEALQGSANIEKVDYCVTRVKCQVVSSQNINEDAIRQAGIQGIIKPSNTSVHLITKEHTQAIYDALVRKLS